MLKVDSIVICLSRLKVSEWAGPIDPNWNKDLLELLNKFEAADCTITTRCYEIGTASGERSYESFRKWLIDIQKKPIQKGVPLKVIT